MTKLQVLAIFLLLAGGAQVFAQQTDLKPVAPDKYAAPVPLAITTAQRPPPAGAPAQRRPARAASDEEFSTGRRVGAVFMNPLLGLGSYTMGDWLGGALISGGYLVAGGLILWEFYGFEYDDDYVGIPGVAGIGLAAATTVFGILRPIFYHRSGSNRRAAAALNGAHIAVIPDAEGIQAVRLSYSIQF
jgi:hypothetical protein